MEFIDLFIIIFYVFIIIIVGLKGRRQSKSSKDLLFGGGKIGGIMSAFSYSTAYFSAVLFIGFAGQIGWNFGISGLWIALFNGFIGVLGVWTLIGWKMKSASQKLEAQTLGEYMEKRYNNVILRKITTVGIFLFLIPYSAAVFMGLSYLFTSNFGMEYWIALTAIGVLTAFYLAMGGYKSVALIDVIFGLIMVGGVFILIYSTIKKAGGFNSIISQLAEIDPQLINPIGPPGFWPLFSIIFLTSIAPFAMPQLLQKFVSIKDKQAIKKGSIASTIFALLIGIIAYFVGSTTRIFIRPEEMPELFINGTPIYDRLMPMLFSTVIPDLLSSLMLLLILSASMSSLASMVLTSSTTFVEDFYKKVQKREVSDTKIKHVAQMANVVFVAISIILALGNFESIVTVMGISWGALGSLFLGPVIWGLYGNPNSFKDTGAIISGLGGLFLCLSLFFAAGFTSPEAGTIGMLFSLIIPPIIAGISQIIINFKRIKNTKNINKEI